MATNYVRINPPVVEFTDVKAGKVYKTTVTVTNTGITSKIMRLPEPTSKVKSFLQCCLSAVSGCNTLVKFRATCA